MDQKDFSLIAFALKGARGRLCSLEASGALTAERSHQECVGALAESLAQRFGRRFNKVLFLKEAGVRPDNSQATEAGRASNGTCRVHCLKEPYDVYIGRGKGGLWGNPFSHLPNTLAAYRVATRDEAVDRHMTYLRQALREQPELLARLKDLKGKRLGCFCEPHERCHGDNLITLIEEFFG